MTHQKFNLNIRHDFPPNIWENVLQAYSRLDGWLGLGDGEIGESGIPYWFSFDAREKHVSASVEPSGLSFEGKMDEQEWLRWKYKTKVVMSQALGLIVGEIEEGEVRQEPEPL